MGAAGDTTPTDPRSRRNRASRRGGQLLTRARSSSFAPACPHLRAPGASVPDGRTIHHSQGATVGHRHRDLIPVTNLLERLFLEERRRLKIIPNAFGERPVLKLMFGAMTRAADRWRAIKFTDFERRQIAAARQELDQEYQAQIGKPAAPSAPASTARFSSSSRT
jgi:hypothetical protein